MCIVKYGLIAIVILMLISLSTITYGDTTITTQRTGETLSDKIDKVFKQVIDGSSDYNQGPALLRALCKEHKTSLSIAAESGLPKGQYLLGLCIFTSQYSSDNVHQNQKEAFSWFLKAANQGLAAAQSQVGSCYNDGRGVEKNPYTAVMWFEKAAQQNYAMAQHYLGICYRSCNGAYCDIRKSYEWELRAAKQGLALAQVDAGHLLWDGTVDLNKYEEVEYLLGDKSCSFSRKPEECLPLKKAAACQWYKKAADQNDPEGIKYVKICYGLGWEPR